MKTKDLSKLPEGAILLVVKNSNGTFSPLGINPDQGRIITAFIGKLSEEQGGLLFGQPGFRLKAAIL